MSRFDIDPKTVAADARKLHEETTKERSAYPGGSPPMPAAGMEEPVTNEGAEASTPSEPMKFHIRMTMTFTEDDPIGRALADRVRSMPERSRKHYSTNRAVKDAIFEEMDTLAKRL